MKPEPVLVIGGTGTLGKEVLPILLSDPRISKVRVLSRGEHRQLELSSMYPQVDFFLGDVRDRERVVRASEDCFGIFNFAAIKSVDKAEIDPEEAVRTNIDGALNVVHAAKVNGCDRAIFTSTDKACAPLNIYGSSKLAAEKVFVAGNGGSHRTRFSAVRYGNVVGSQGSVIEKWRSGEKRVTDPCMTRFWISPKDAAMFVYTSYLMMNGGEVFVPLMKSSTIGEVFDVVNGGEMERIPIRSGEKIHESLISEEEAKYAYQAHDRFIIAPTHNTFPFMRGKPLERGVHSNTSERFTKEELKCLFAL